MYRIGAKSEGNLSNFYLFFLLGKLERISYSSMLYSRIYVFLPGRKRRRQRQKENKKGVLLPFNYLFPFLEALTPTSDKSSNHQQRTIKRQSC